MTIDRNSAEYTKASAQAKNMLELMQMCFANMQVCMRMNNSLATGKITTEMLAKVQEEAAKRVQETFDRFLDNDGNSPGFEIITKIAKALSEEFLMDYFTEQKKNAPEPAKTRSARHCG